MWYKNELEGVWALPDLRRFDASNPVLAIFKKGITSYTFGKQKQLALRGLASLKVSLCRETCQGLVFVRRCVAPFTRLCETIENRIISVGCIAILGDTPLSMIWLGRLVTEKTFVEV